MKELNTFDDFYAHSKTAPKRSGWIENNEAKILYDLVAAFDYKDCYESGTKYGWSAMWMAKALLEKGKGKVFTFDPIPQFKLDAGTNLEPAIQRYQMKFHEGIDTLLKTRSDGAILIFIDGDHSTIGVTRDWCAVLPYLKSGDKVVFHDNSALFPGIQALIHDLSTARDDSGKDTKYTITTHETAHRITDLLVK